MPLWYRARSLKSQLALGFGAVIVLTLILGAVAYISEQRSIAAVDNLLTREGRMADLSLRSAAAMLKARRAERDLLLSLDVLGVAAARARYVPLVQLNLTDMQGYAASVRTLAADPKVNEKVSQIEFKAQQYEKGFLALIDLYAKLGHVDSGWEGQFRQQARDLEVLLGASRNQALMIDLLNLRRYEKNFIHRIAHQDVLQFLDGVKKLRAHLQESRLAPAEKQRIGMLLTEYSQIFLRYAEVADAVTTAKDDYVGVALAIEPLLEELHAMASARAIETGDRVGRAARVTAWAIIVTAAIAAILGAIVAFFVSQRITGAVTQLVAFAKRLASGDFSARTIPSGENEFAIIGGALNRMTEALEESHAAIQGRALELAHSNDALQREMVNRKSAEQALRLKNRAIESSINAIFLTNNSALDNPIEYVNPAFERMTGYMAAEVMGRNSRFLQGAEQDQPGIVIIQDAVRHGCEGYAVLRNYRKDGTLFWSELYIAPVSENGEMPTHFVGALNDITEAKQLEAQLTHRANYDALTGLPNRILLMDRIGQAIAIAGRQQGRAIVAFLDLDRFKFINDSLGHDAGDILLREIGIRLLDCVRDSDTVARLGGDEFVIVLQDELVGSVSLPVMQRIVERIAQPVSLMGGPHAVTCSIGISIYPQDGNDAETLMKNADTAMYRAKEIGRNCFQFFMPEMNARLNERLQLETDLSGALEHEEFELYYQPQVDLRSGNIIGCEALIRWHHPAHGMIMPGRFVPVAEESDLILHIGEWVIRQACRQNKVWMEAGLPALPVAVNLSARQFDRQDIPALLVQVLRETGLKPGLLELEITEGLSMQDPQKTIDIIGRLKAIGVGVAIDDFGTGYSNLTYLKKFPVDKLKLDRSFILDITDNPEDNAISTAIIEMGHSLHLKVIAEGVERESQLSILKARGCDQLQGYLFSPPLPAPEFAEMLRSGRQLELVQQSRKKGERTLLLLDDEKPVLSVLTRALASKTYRILQADNVRDAFELLATHEVDVILSDQRMPGMTGLEFLKRVQKMHPGIVRMMVSGFVDQDTLLSAINSGTVFKFLCKPWDLKDLCAALEEAFEKAAASAETHKK